MPIDRTMSRGIVGGHRRHKFNAQPTKVDGVRFASKREARRYAELKLLEKAGEIRGLVLQQKYPLEVEADEGAARRQVIGFYVADFSYFDRDGKDVVEDAKGFRTPMYRWKRRHFEAQYGITIREV